MLRSLVICPDANFSGQLDRAAAEVEHLAIIRRLREYPESFELVRLIRAHAPQVVFISLDSRAKVAETLATVESTVPGVQIVAMNPTADPQVLLEVMRMGIREFISLPLRPETLQELVDRLNELVEKKPAAVTSTDLLFAFLPAKAGAGTSTVALNAAGALAKSPETNVLLVDFDMNSGMLRFMLKLDNPYSVSDAAEHSSALDEKLWPRLVTSLDQLDVLHSGAVNPNFRIEPLQIRYLLDFARRNYRAICVDLSGNMEKYSLEIMRESKRVFLVCTPEIPSLHLARDKYSYLRSLDLGDRVALVINRSDKRSVVSPAQIEEILGIPVHATFSNDYQGVHRALTAGTMLDPKTALGRQIAAFAGLMAETTPKAVPQTKKRLVEYFTMLPARHTLFPDSRRTAG